MDRLEAMAKISKGKPQVRELWIVAAPGGEGLVDIFAAFTNEDDAWEMLVHLQDETSAMFSPGADVHYIELNVDYLEVLGRGRNVG